MATFNSQNFSTNFNLKDFSSRLNEPEAELIIVDIANEISTSQGKWEKILKDPNLFNRPLSYTFCMVCSFV